MDQALSEGRRLRHAHTLALVLTFATWIDVLTRSPMTHIEEVLALSNEHGFRFYLGWALAHRGQSLVALGQAQEGLELLTQALVELRPTGGVVTSTPLLTWLAEAHTKLGQPAQARNNLARLRSSSRPPTSGSTKLNFYIECRAIC